MQQRPKKAGTKARYLQAVIKVDREARQLARTGYRPTIWGVEVWAWSARRQLCQEWCHLLDELTTQGRRRALELGWKNIVQELQAEAGRWNRVKGPMGAIAATLLDLRWEPLAPALWRAPDGEECNLDDRGP